LDATIFPKSEFGFQFWTFIFVHFSKPNWLFGKNMLNSGC